MQTLDVSPVVKGKSLLAFDHAGCDVCRRRFVIREGRATGADLRT
jgi:hypothetical protein